MSRIAMDREVMARHAEVHEEVSEIVKGKLDGIPSAVDGGLASDSIAAILQRVGNGVDALYRINRTLGEIVKAISDDSVRTEEDALERLAPVARELEELGS